MCTQLLLHPAANCTLDLDFFSSFLLLQIAFPKNLVALSTLLTLCSLSVDQVSFLEWPSRVGASFTLRTTCFNNGGCGENLMCA